MKAAFTWADPLLLDAQLNEDERAVRDTAQRYCREMLAPRVLQAFRTETTVVAIFREMGELGLLGATIPEQYGGAGFTMSAMASSPGRSSASTPATVR